MIGKDSNLLADLAEVRAHLVASAKAGASIIGSLPPGVMILIYVSTPAYIMLLWTTQFGNGRQAQLDAVKPVN